MRISQQLAVLTLCAVAVIVALAASSFYCVRLLRESHERAAKTASTLEDTQELCYHAAYASAVQKSYMISGRAESKEIYENEIDTAKQLLVKLQGETQNNGEEQQLFSNFAKCLTERLDNLDTTIRIYETRGREAAYERIRQGIGLTIMTHLVAAANQLTSYEHGRLNQQTRLVDINANNTELAIIFGSLIAIAIIAISNILFSRNLSNAVTNLLRASQNVARERFESLVNVQSNNELGDLGRAFNTLTGHLRHKSEELDAADLRLSAVESDLKNSLKQTELLANNLKSLVTLINESDQDLELSEKYQRRLENEIKETLSLSDMIGVSLHQLLDFSREVRVHAEGLDKRCSDLNTEVGQFTDQAERTKTNVEALWNVLPETKELVTRLETLDSELSVLEVVSDVTHARGDGGSSSEMAVIIEKLKNTRQSLSNIRSQLNVNVSRIQQMTREALDASSGFVGLLKGSMRPLESLFAQSKQLLQATLTSRGELTNADHLHKRQANAIDEVGKCYSHLNSSISKSKDLAVRARSKASSLSLDSKRQINSEVAPETIIGMDI